MDKGPKFFGKALVGTKGQIVIPAEARKELGIKPGDSVMIVSGPPHNKSINIIPEDEFNKFLIFLEGHLSMMKKEINQEKPSARKNKK